MLLFRHSDARSEMSWLLCHVIVLQVERRMLAKLSLDWRRCGAGGFQPKCALSSHAACSSLCGVPKMPHSIFARFESL